MTSPRASLADARPSYFRDADAARSRPRALPVRTLDAERRLKVNGLVCFCLRGNVLDSVVRLNGADGFEAATVCQCDLAYFLDKKDLHDCLGVVTWERQQQIKSRLTLAAWFRLSAFHFLLFFRPRHPPSVVLGRRRVRHLTSAFCSGPSSSSARSGLG